MQRPTEAAFQRHKAGETHKLENPLRDIILGGQDGLVNALGIILGIAAVTPDVHILIATVLAATCAESISMGAVAYTSALSQKDHYESEKQKELKEIENEPEMEKEEIRQLYEAKGFQGKVLEEITETITKDKHLWLMTMMRDELNLQQIDMKNVLKSSVIVTIATAIGHLIPLLPFFFVYHQTGIVVSLIVSAITLFLVGWYQAVTLVGSWWRSGIRMVIIGIGAAFVGYIIAKLFHTTS
ncbi:MAG TPA: VIT1/CCC1 transporter family protein [Patescibacteria group bacterium]|nr:VIT1/CCC1 transporter family protein [Patescibacteria group bacterium]